jgi:hypothetical protein
MHKQPNLMALQSDRDSFKKDSLRYSTSWLILTASIPLQLVCMYKMQKDPVKNKKFLAGGAYMTTFALGFFFYSGYKH